MRGGIGNHQRRVTLGDQLLEGGLGCILVLQLLPLLVGVVQKRRYGDPAIDRPPSKLVVLAANIRGSNPLSSDLVTELLTIKDILHFNIFQCFNIFNISSVICSVEL